MRGVGEMRARPIAARRNAVVPEPVVELFVRCQRNRPRRILRREQAKKVPHWLDTLRDEIDLGDVKVKACGLTMDLFGLKLEDLEPMVGEVLAVISSHDGSKNDIPLWLMKAKHELPGTEAVEGATRFICRKPH